MQVRTTNWHSGSCSHTMEWDSSSNQHSMSLEWMVHLSPIFWVPMPSTSSLCRTLTKLARSIMSKVIANVMYLSVILLAMKLGCHHSPRCHLWVEPLAVNPAERHPTIETEKCTERSRMHLEVIIAVSWCGVQIWGIYMEASDSRLWSINLFPFWWLSRDRSVSAPFFDPVPSPSLSHHHKQLVKCGGHAQSMQSRIINLGYCTCYHLNQLNSTWW